MEFFVILALIGFGLLITELLLPTGGALAALGTLGLIAGGVLALGSNSDAADYIGPALITLGVLSGITFYVVTRKVIAAHDEAVRTGSEELVGAQAEVRTPLDPDGQVWIEGALWRARLVGEGGSLRPGDRVIVEAIDGLTLSVRPDPSVGAEEGAG